MRVELQHGGEHLLADVDVEEEVRRARLFAEDHVRYAPWTGEHFRKLGEVAELAEAFDSPDARFAAFVRAGHFPWGALLVTVGIALAGAIQLGAMFAGSFSPDLGARVDSAVLGGATGYEPLVLDGAWWTPWTSQLLHVGLLHLVGNLPVLAYCSFRVERALGASGLAAVGAAAVFGGTALVTAFGALPVLGSSILAYGFWGAQIAIGFRVGGAMPPGWRGFYGWGNLVLFVPLFVSSLGAEGISHLGHVGGLLGGLLVASLLPAESFAPRAAAPARRLRAFQLAAALAALPMLVAPALARLSPSLSLPGDPVDVRGAGVTLELPWRMAENPVRVAGLPGWLVSPNRDEPVFCGLSRLPTAEDPDDAALAEAWALAYDADVSVDPGPPPLRDGFTSRTFVLRDRATEVELGRVVEHTLRRGVWLLRAGYHLDAAVDPTARVGEGGREALYRDVLATLVVSDPPPLAAARKDRERYPSDPEYAWTYGRELARAGAYADADAVWTELGARTDGWEWEAARARARMWADLRGTDPAALDGLAPLDTRVAWILGWLDRAPAGDAELHVQGLRLLVAEGICDRVVTRVDALLARGPDDPLRSSVAEVVGACPEALARFP
jgi:membrane associated rhomboid family serine protease